LDPDSNPNSKPGSISGGKVSGTDSHKNAEVRGLLAPLAELAQRHRVAVLTVTHLNKSRDNSVLYRAMGSLGFVAAARAALLMVRDKNPARRLVLPVKNNLAPLGDGLAFRFFDGAIAWDSEPVLMSADDALTDESTDQTERDDAADWLEQLLTDGPIESNMVKKLARENGHTWATVRRAKSDLGIKARKQGFGDGAVWSWSLPGGRRRSEDPEDARDETVSAFDDGERLCVFDAENGVSETESEPSITEGAHVENDGDDGTNGVPVGWTRASWAACLRHRASACESHKPHRAAELRAEADSVERRRA
ncbi:MAG: helicase RepA family protein, partial [Phycisphaerales bacterium]|nr:helicase RepA family protein [Phycisphaerales bacterium]